MEPFGWAVQRTPPVRAGDEVLHKVQISRPFFLAETEVTQAQWKQVMGTAPSYFKGPNRPVERVSWYDAALYLNALSARENLEPCYVLDCQNPRDKGQGCLDGKIFCSDKLDCGRPRFVDNCAGYRLPTEAEWEWAAQGVRTATQALSRVAWHGGDETHPVAQLQATRGLYDLLGNVWEWVHDDYGGYNIDDPETAVPDPVRFGNGQLAVNRGCGFLFALPRSAARPTAATMVAPSASHDVGFRPARSSTLDP